MENMGTILVHVDAIHFLTVDVAANMVTALNHEYRLTSIFRFMSKYCPKQTTAYN